MTPRGTVGDLGAAVAQLTRKKRRWIVYRMLERGRPEARSVGWIAAQQRVSKQTCYDLLNAYLEEGWQALDDKPKGRPPNPRPLTIEQRKAIVAWRKETGWGAERMEAMMRIGTPHWPQDWPVVPHNRINELFREAGLTREGRKRGKKHKYIRFERTHSNSLWQTDWHWLPQEEQWLIAYLDDHSRFVPGAGTFAERSSENALAIFEEAGNHFGFPQQVLSDHGSEFTSTNPLGEHHVYEDRLAELGVEHIMGKVKKPTTQGKIERFFGTYKEELGRFPTLEARIVYYNFQRPHMSLHYDVPARVYGRDLPLDQKDRGEVLAHLAGLWPGPQPTGGQQE